MISRVVEILFVAFLVAGVPALSYSTGRSFQVRCLPRVSLYISAVVSQWILLGVGILVVLLFARPTLAVLQFRSAALVIRWTAILAVASLGGLGLTLFLER